MNALSFFSGAGGLDIGFHKAGFNIKLCVELNPKFCQTVLANYPNWNVKCGDIMLYDKKRVLKDKLLMIHVVR